MNVSEIPHLLFEKFAFGQTKISEALKRDFAPCEGGDGAVSLSFNGQYQVFHFWPTFELARDCSLIGWSAAFVVPYYKKGEYKLYAGLGAEFVSRFLPRGGMRVGIDLLDVCADTEIDVSLRTLLKAAEILLEARKLANE